MTRWRRAARRRAGGGILDDPDAGAKTRTRTSSSARTKTQTVSDSPSARAPRDPAEPPSARATARARARCGRRCGDPRAPPDGAQRGDVAARVGGRLEGRDGLRHRHRARIPSSRTSSTGIDAEPHLEAARSPSVHGAADDPGRAAHRVAGEGQLHARREDAHAASPSASAGSTKTVSERFISCAMRCICSDESARASVKTASALPSSGRP